jgi:signal transduction histidine kinase
MAGVEHIQLQQFEVAGIAAPPALLCQQLEQTGLGSSTSGQLPNALDLILCNPALLVRVLDAQHKLRPQQQALQLSQRLAGLDVHWLHSLLSDTALQLVLQGARQDQCFPQLYWQQSRQRALLARHLAQALSYPDLPVAEACALLLHAGQLVLEQQHGESWQGLYQEIEWQERLLDAESQTLGLDHIQAGIRLLESWQLEQDCLDALRYQVVEPSLILDATPLVRICWLANRLTSRNTATIAAGREAAINMTGLSAERLDALMQQAQGAFLEECASWGSAQHKPLALPLADVDRRRFESEVKEELLALQRQMLGETALAALDALDTGSNDMLKAVLARALQQAGIDPRFIVLQSAAASSGLTLCTSNKVPALPAELSLVLETGRSRLADLVLTGDLAVLAPRQEGLAVIDRQLIDLLGGSAVLCEPVQTDNGRVVLLLSNSAAYPQRKLLRAFMRRKLAGLHLREKEAGNKYGTIDLMLYQQRVSEAVHEANNPLAIIKNYLQILNMKLGENGASKEIRHINTEIDRVAAILAGLRRSESRPSAAVELDINLLVHNMHRVFQQAYSANAGIAMELDLADDPALALASADAMKQILTNLVKNAAEACGKGGRITISTRRNVLLDERLYLQLSVADSGPGITTAQLPTLFTGGTSTKGGEHRGSGLVIVKRLVEEMQGQVSCQTDSKGTRMTILLLQTN